MDNYITPICTTHIVCLTQEPLNKGSCEPQEMHQKKSIKYDRAPTTEHVLSDLRNKPKEWRGVGTWNITCGLHYIFIGIIERGIGEMFGSVMKQVWRYSHTNFTPPSLNNPAANGGNDSCGPVWRETKHNFKETQKRSSVCRNH